MIKLNDYKRYGDFVGKDKKKMRHICIWSETPSSRKFLPTVDYISLVIFSSFLLTWFFFYLYREFFKYKFIVSNSLFRIILLLNKRYTWRHDVRQTKLYTIICSCKNSVFFVLFWKVLPLHRISVMVLARFHSAKILAQFIDKWQ